MINEESRPRFDIGDQVIKKKGYNFPGEVRASFTNKKGLLRYVVECTVPDVAGMLHIYNESQLDFA